MTSAFRFGYFGSARPPVGAADLLTGWKQVKVGGWSFWLHPELHWGISERRGTTVLIAGEAIDLAAGDSDEKVIATRTAKALENSGLQEAVRYVAYLGGRFACFINDGDRLIAIPDDHGMQPIFWTQTAVSSHAPLIAEAVGAGPDKEVLALLGEIGKARGKGFLYHPATITPFESVRLLLPNHLLSVEATGRHSVERFYPFPDTQLDGDPESAYETFGELFLAHTRHICEYRRVGVALTSGWDSRTCLAAARRFIQRNRGFTFTYQNFVDPPKGTMKDLLGANELAFKLRLPHRIMPILEIDDASEFGRIYARSSHRSRQFPAGAHALHHGLPPDVTHMISFGAETGNSTLRGRTDSPEPTPTALARLYRTDDAGRLESVVRLYERFLEDEEFTADRLAPLDYRDVFYWEQRGGRWCVNRMVEADLSSRTLAPFNQRGITEAMLSLPFADRDGRTMQRRFITDHLWST